MLTTVNIHVNFHIHTHKKKTFKDFQRWCLFMAAFKNFPGPLTVSSFFFKFTSFQEFKGLMKLYIVCYDCMAANIAQE